MPQLKLVRMIDASPHTVFHAVVTREGLASWFGPDDGPVLIAESDPRVGGHYRVRFRMLDGTEHEARGQFLKFEPPHRVVMSYQWLGSEDIGPSRLEISLRAVGSGTELTLIHADLHDESVRKCHEDGWTGALNKLQRLYAKPGS